MDHLASVDSVMGGIYGTLQFDVVFCVPLEPVLAPEWVALLWHPGRPFEGHVVICNLQAQPSVDAM